MLSAAVPTVVGMSDTARPLLLIGFVVLMFAVAGLAILLGKRSVAAKQAKALSGDTGVDKGAMRGSDTTFSAEWLAETRAQADEGPKQSWKDLILGPGSLHDDDAEHPQILPPEIHAQQESAALTEEAAWGAQDADAWATTGGDHASAWTTHTEDPAAAYASAAPEYPAYLQPETEQPAPVPPAPQPYTGKHAAPAGRPTPAAPFLVDSGLDDED